MDWIDLDLRLETLKKKNNCIHEQDMPTQGKKFIQDDFDITAMKR
jgi:hypothetical protein